VRRGDVVVIEWPFSGGAGTKARPAVIVQNDKDNQRMTNTIVAMVTSRLYRVGEPTQFLVDVSTPEGKQAGLHQTSVINCANLFTLNQAKILQTIGSLSAALVVTLNDCLKAALEL
jgi:mRNA interferase MazF